MQSTVLIMANKIKTLLDTCHLLPNDNILGCATTFVFGSTNPHLIHPDFRDGKMSKFYIDFPKDDNISYILKEQLENIKLHNKNIEKLQKMEIYV